MDVRCALFTEPSEVTPSSDRHQLFCRAARRRHELRVAFRLIYDRYYRDGLTPWSPHGLRILPHQLLDTSWVLLANRGRRSLGTLSLIEDGTMGLPMEQLYPEEVWQLRRQQKRIAELACFAMFDQPAAQCMCVLRELLHATCEISFRREIDELLICVHPSRADFYERRLGFEKFGPRRDCPWVCGQPAVAMKLVLQAGSRETGVIARRGAQADRCSVWAEAEDLRFADRAFFWRLLDQSTTAARPCRIAA